MLTALLEDAVRGASLLAAVWVLVKALRVRDPAVEKNAWTLIVAAALVMPMLSWLTGVIAAPIRMVPLSSLLPSRAGASTAALTGMASGGSGLHLEFICVTVYATVTTVLLAQLVTGLFLGRRLRRRATALSGPVAGSADVRVSAALRSPASFASTILLPPTHETWDDATLLAVVAHEQAHIRNLDCYRLWLAALYRALFWFDPLAHWLLWRLRDLTELTSDEAAVATVGNRALYAATLNRMAAAPHWIPSTLAMADSSSLGRRIRRLLSEQDSAASLAKPWRALLLGGVLVMVVMSAAPWARAVAPAEQRAASLEFRLVDQANDPVLAQQSGHVPAGETLFMDRNGTPILLKEAVVATSAEISQVTVTSTATGSVVEVTLDAHGAAAMLDTTRANIGSEMAAVYNRRVINHAVIRGVFSRQFQVTGLSDAEAQTLAMQFNQAIR